jgi:hypothetical protein
MSKNNKIYIGIGIVMMLCIGNLVLAGLAVAEVPHPQVLVLTSQENGTVPEDTFSCSGTIYGYLTFPQTQIGKHVLEGIWTGPKGQVIQQSRNEVDYASPGSRTAFVWLSFSKEGRSLWNPLSIQHAGDEDWLLYDGKWEIEVRWDDHSLAHSAFQVHCPNSN